MNKNTAVIIGGIALIVLAGTVFAFISNRDDAMMDTKGDDSTMMQKESDSMVKNDMPEEKEMMNEDEGMESKDTMMKVGSYETYAPEKLARAETGDVVLFFHASWCPSCRGLSTDIESNMSAIPEGVSILKVDYDKEIELKKKYGVTYQHTLVQVDKDGNLIKKWSGTPKLSNLLAEIQ
jgi:thiol-disulfide isomerase/thioredoxin